MDDKTVAEIESTAASRCTVLRSRVTRVSWGDSAFEAHAAPPLAGRGLPKKQPVRLHCAPSVVALKRLGVRPRGPPEPES